MGPTWVLWNILWNVIFIEGDLKKLITWKGGGATCHTLLPLGCFDPLPKIFWHLSSPQPRIQIDTVDINPYKHSPSASSCVMWSDWRRVAYYCVGIAYSSVVLCRPVYFLRIASTPKVRESVHLANPFASLSVQLRRPVWRRLVWLADRVRGTKSAGRYCSRHKICRQITHHAEWLADSVPFCSYRSILKVSFLWVVYGLCLLHACMHAG